MMDGFAMRELKGIMTCAACSTKTWWLSLWAGSFGEVFFSTTLRQRLGFVAGFASTQYGLPKFMLDVNLRLWHWLYGRLDSNCCFLLKTIMYLCIVSYYWLKKIDPCPVLKAVWLLFICHHGYIMIYPLYMDPCGSLANPSRQIRRFPSCKIRVPATRREGRLMCFSHGFPLLLFWCQIGQILYYQQVIWCKVTMCVCVCSLIPNDTWYIFTSSFKCPFNTFDHLNRELSSPRVHRQLKCFTCEACPAAVLFAVLSCGARAAAARHHALLEQWNEAFAAAGPHWTKLDVWHCLILFRERDRRWGT